MPGPPTVAPPEDLAICSILGCNADRGQFQAAFRGIQDRLLRLKGIVDFGDCPVLVEAVFDTLTERPFRGNQPRFGITVIGWKITAEEMTRAFAAAIRSTNVPLVQIAALGPRRG